MGYSSATLPSPCPSTQVRHKTGERWVRINPPFHKQKNPNQKWLGFPVAEKMGFGGVATTGAMLCVGNLVRFHIFVENKKARAGR